MNNIALIHIGLFLAIATLWIVLALTYNYFYLFILRRFGTVAGDWTYAGCIFRWCRVDTDNAFDKAIHYPILEPTNEAGKQFLGKWVVCRASQYGGLDRVGLHRAGQCPWCRYLTRTEFDLKFRRGKK